MAWGVSETAAVATGTTSLVMDVPSGVAENDLLVCRMVHKGAGFATLTGWTNVAQVLQGSTRGEMYWRRASGSEPATYTATGLATCAIGYIQRWPGALESGAILTDVTSRGNAMGVNGTAALSSTVGNALVVGMAAMGGNVSPGTSPELTDPNGPGVQYLLRQSVSQQSATGTGCALGGEETIWLIPGEMGRLLSSSGTGAENVAILATFAPEPDAATGTFTTFYATGKAAGTTLHGVPQGDWDQARPQNRGVHHWQFLLDPYPTAGGVSGNETFGAGSLQTADEDLFVERWITPTLAAQTLSGNLDLCFGTDRGDAAPATMVYHVYAYLTVGDSLTERAVLVNDVIDTNSWTETRTYRQLNAPTALAGEDVTAGDRIVVEIGVRATPTSVGSTDNFGTLAWGTTDAFQLPLALAANGGTADAAAWVSFSDGLEIQDNTPSAPANDACADATAITSLPYSLANIDTRGSLGPHRAVYWSFTPTETARYFVSTLGGNHSTSPRVYTGACGALSTVTSTLLARRSGAQGTAQSVAYFDGTAGTAYTIEVQTYTPNLIGGGAFTSMDSGGVVTLALTQQDALASGDLIMLSQHVVRYRAGAIQACQSAFYGSIPSGAVIDYSRREMASLNGGTVSDLRLLVGLFASGDGDIVEILDLATLNVGESEIDFINTPFAGNEKIQSLQISSTGILYAGWDGDNYTWIGGLSSAAACAIRGISAINGDSQSGAPFTATSFQATREVQGSDYITLAADQQTIWYCSAGQSIFRCNILTETQGTVFATLPVESGPRPGLRQLVLLPPYDGSGGLLVCEGINVKRLDAAGAIIQTYTPSVSARYQDIDKITLDPDGVHVRFADALSASVATFVIESGVQTDDFQTGLPPGQVSGITIYSEGAPAIFPTFATTTEPIRRLRRAVHLTDENVRQFFRRFELECERGVGLTTGQGEDALVMLRFSTDGGKTWSNERRMSMGRLGEYSQRVFTAQLGSGRDYVFEVTTSDPVFVAWIDAFIQVDRGHH